MGCFRLGCAFFGSLFATAIFTVIGAIFGTVISLMNTGSLSNIDLSSPLNIVQAHPTGALIGGGIGALIGLGVMAATMKRASDITWLKKHGQRITATVADIETKRESRQIAYSTGRGMQYRTEWQTFYVVVARWKNPQTSSVQTFRSERRSLYPRKYAPGSSISVLIDTRNSGRYYVEV